MQDNAGIHAVLRFCRSIRVKSLAGKSAVGCGDWHQVMTRAHCTPMTNQNTCMQTQK